MEMTLKEFAELRRIDDKMLWKSGAKSQLALLAGPVTELMLAADAGAKVTVRSTHTSKSIVLPVVELRSEKLGIVFYARENFYNWAVTVESEREIHGEEGEEVHGYLFEGFERGGLPVYEKPEATRRSLLIWGGNGPFLEFLEAALSAAAETKREQS